MKSPRYRPAGLLVEFSGSRVMFDGGPGAEPHGNLDAWLITDDQGELIREIRALARKHGVEARVGRYKSNGFTVTPRRVVHTSHPTYGYLLKAKDKKVVWAPEFYLFPRWAQRADLMFAEAAGWNRPIHFAKHSGGHCPVFEVATEGERRGVRRLVFAHIGRPTIRAMDASQRPPFGEFGSEGRMYRLRLQS
jgi:ribonuclease BN (tRNA processing enzyme)